MARQQTEWDSRGYVVPEAEPYRPPTPALAPEPPTARELFNQRFAGATLMLALLFINAQLWGIGDSFKFLFLVYTILMGYWIWAGFVKQPPPPS